MNKINLVFALAAVLVASPLVAAPAADKAPAKEEAAEQAGPTPEQLKARKARKPSYTKLVEAKAAAEKCGLPLLIAILPEGLPPAQAQAVNMLKQKVLNHKAFMKDFAAQNCVFAFMKVKADSKNPKQVDTKPMKEPELKFIENFAVNKQMIAKAKAHNQDEPKYTDMKCYPAVICVDSTCQKELFRLASYDKEGGFGVWLSQVADMFRTAGIEPVLSPLVQKIVDNPDEPKKWK